MCVMTIFDLNLFEYLGGKSCAEKAACDEAYLWASDASAAGEF